MASHDGTPRAVRRPRVIVHCALIELRFRVHAQPLRYCIRRHGEAGGCNHIRAERRSREQIRVRLEQTAAEPAAQLLCRNYLTAIVA